MRVTYAYTYIYRCSFLFVVYMLFSCLVGHYYPGGGGEGGEGGGGRGKGGGERGEREGFDAEIPIKVEISI